MKNDNIEVKNGVLEVGKLTTDSFHWQAQLARIRTLSAWVKSENRKREQQEQFEAQRSVQQPQDRSIRDAARALMIQNTQHKRVVL